MKIILGDKVHDIPDHLTNRYEVIPYGPAFTMPMNIPSVRTARANADGVQFNYLITATGGGLGDTICAEPTIRYFIEEFKWNFPDVVKVSVLTRFPELFRHLESDLDNLFKVGECDLDPRKYNVLATAVGENDFLWEFINMGFMHCLDAPSMCSMGRQLPVKYRELCLIPRIKDEATVNHFLHKAGLTDQEKIVVHPGKTWPSRTLPADYWNKVTIGLIQNGFTPILIGAKCENGNSTVEVNPEGCLDLRNRLELMETVALLQMADVVLTNDSAPLHMAASGESWIGFFGTARHPDFITYQRNGVFGFKMQNLALSGMWDTMDLRPGQMEMQRYDQIDESILRSWLPEPSSVVNWVTDKF
jgi:hypothetical protein